MRKQTLSVGLLALLASSALGQATLTGIEASKAGQGLQIVIHGEELSNPRVQRVLKNTSYIVEFDCKLTGKPSTTKINDAGVKYIQYGWYRSRPPICRVHVKCDPNVTPTLTQLNGNWVILIGTTGIEALATGTSTSPSTPGTAPADQDRLAMENALKQLTESTPSTTAKPDEIIAEQQKTTVEAKPIEQPKTTKTVQSRPEKTEKPVTGPTVLPEAFDSASGSMASLATDIEPKVPSTTLPATSQRAKPRANDQRFGQNVSLDFVSTDVVQILKALSIQAGVNIVTSPDVSPSDKPMKLSITLNNVELESALSYVTAMANLRYARIGNTFVVAPTSTFSAAMRQIMERNADSYQTRVVNLMSGEAEKIKEATLKAMPPDGRNGYYEIIVPGEPDSPANVTPAAAGPVTGADLGGLNDPAAQLDQKAPQQPAQTATQPKAKGRAYYLMIVGEPTRLSSVEDYVRSLDEKVASSFSLSRSQSTGTVAVPIQSGQTMKIKTMIEKLLEGNPRSGDYSITETAVKELEQGEQSTTFLLMIGPASELETLRNYAVSLDKELCKPLGIEYVSDSVQMVKDYEVVELKFMEPVIAAQDLKGRFKDLWVTVVPDAATPGLKGEGESKKEEGPSDSGNGQGGQQSTGQKQTSDLKKILGREPMRLILRGTRSTIEEAKRYISLIDVAPKQIALELRVLEMTREDAFKLGLDWSILAGGRASVVRINQGLGQTASDAGVISGTDNFGQKNNGVNGNKPFFENVNVLGTLDKLTNDRNLIARPNALVTHGRETNLFVGDTVRYIKQIQTSQNGVSVITDELQVGSTFNIKAKIGDGGNIALDLLQNFSVLTGFIPVPGGGQLPQTSDRTSSMFVNMHSGETIAIGGLILDNDRKSYGGIPILKDLPIIGKLFGRTNNGRTRTEIVFFLTAVEVNNENRATAASPATSYNKTPDPLGDYKKSKSAGVNKMG